MTQIRQAMVLAAGLGLRMRPLTELRPKALVEVRGKPLIDWALEALIAAGVEKVVVNTHYFAEELERHLGKRKDIAISISRETELLETGGGIKKALAHFGGQPFYRVNADVIWLDGYHPALKRLADAWRNGEMDALLLLALSATAHGHEGKGDFLMDGLGRLKRRPQSECAPFVFSSVEILHPRLFDGAPEGAFSLNLLYDRAIEDGRLYGLRHDGEWFDIGTPRALAEAEKVLSDLGFKRKASQ